MYPILYANSTLFLAQGTHYTRFLQIGKTRRNAILIIYFVSFSITAFLTIKAVYFGMNWNLANWNSKLQLRTGGSEISSALYFP